MKGILVGALTVLVVVMALDTVAERAWGLVKDFVGRPRRRLEGWAVAEAGRGAVEVAKRVRPRRPTE
jgi:hypothetical protein